MRHSEVSVDVSVLARTLVNTVRVFLAPRWIDVCAVSYYDNMSICVSEIRYQCEHDCCTEYQRHGPDCHP